MVERRLVKARVGGSNPSRSAIVKLNRRWQRSLDIKTGTTYAFLMASKTRDMAKYLRERYQRRKAKAVERLGGCCCRCGSTENLEIDHIDRTQKTMSFSRMYVVSRKRFEEELSKCQILCKPCHTDKSIEERGHNRRTEHGTYACYRYSKCRCTVCRQACRENSRRYREKKKKMGFIRKNDKWVAS